MNDNCVFCDRTKLEERLIVENRDWYVVATLGQITDGGYTLVIPKKHILCMGALNPEQTSSMLEVLEKIRNVIALEYRLTSAPCSNPVLMFEHGIVGQTVKHAHIHLLPAVLDITQKIRCDFPAIEIQKVDHNRHLQTLYYNRKEPYLFWTVPNREAMVCWNPPAPSQYLRLVVAELLGRPERGNWRNMDPELDKRLGQETVERLKKYFS